VGTVVAQVAALRFFVLRVLKRRDMKEDLPYPKRRKRLPVVLSPEEVQRLIAGAKNLYHRTLVKPNSIVQMHVRRCCQLSSANGMLHFES
jgi:integrase/recombinase XerD